MAYQTGAMAESMSKVKKSRNFSAVEVEVLIDNVEKYKTILNCRLKNSVTNADKRRVCVMCDTDTRQTGRLLILRFHFY